MDFEEPFDPDKLSFDPVPCDTPRILPIPRPESKKKIPVNVEKKKVKTVSMISNLILSQSGLCGRNLQ